MSTVVIMPGGFHPFHAGHLALYNSARQAFPGAEVYVAATNDTSTRPFPFSLKEKLAKLAGVEPGHFVQVKSPFKADEITSKYNPEKDRLIFVRSEKDATKPPQPGGVKKDGSPTFLQPLAGQTNIRPFKEHAYMAYLPTVPFAGGKTSATEIRAEWPTLTSQGKLERVASLYPAAQKNPKLAANVAQLLDTAILGEEAMSPMEAADEKHYHGWEEFDEDRTAQIVEFLRELRPELVSKFGQGYLEKIATNVFRANPKKSLTQLAGDVIRSIQQQMAENQGFAATLESECQTAGTPAPGGMWAGYQQRENQPIDEDYIDEKWSQKYKNSINCAKPRGFSQRAHCAGRKK